MNHLWSFLTPPNGTLDSLFGMLIALPKLKKYSAWFMKTPSWSPLMSSSVVSKALLEFLRKVVAHEEENRMSLWNVSMIVAPNLFISRSKNAKLEEMQGAAGAAHLVRLLITSQDLLWTVSVEQPHLRVTRGRGADSPCLLSPGPLLPYLPP